LPTIVQQPQSKAVPVGANVTFTVGQCGLPPFTYIWLYNGVPKPNANNSYLSLSNVQLTDSGNYSVVVSNAAGSVTSLLASLIVQTPPSIVVQPQSQTVTGYTTATFTVTPGGIAPFQYQWRFNGGNLLGETNQTLVMTNIMDTRAGQYSVLILNTAGQILSSNATLTVNMPAKITQQPQPVVTTNTYSARFFVLASGPNLSYQWHFNGVPIPTNVNATANSATLQLNNVVAGQEGYYSVLASNQFGADWSQPAFLTVRVTPYFTENPQSQTVVIGSDVMFHVTYGGTEPMKIRWRFGGSTVVPFESGTETYWLRNARLENAGTYSAVVTNVAKTNGVICQSAYLTVFVPPMDRMVLLGSNITLSVLHANTNLLKYQWQSNGVNILNATNPTHTLFNATNNYAGRYSLVVTNLAGQVTNWAMNLTVQSTAVAPVITQQPTNRLAATNATALFLVNATGTDPLSFQWYWNGASLYGQTNSTLTIGGLATNHTGDYQVVVTNQAGAVTSQVATLTVLEPPVIVTQPRDLASLLGGNVFFSVAVVGAPPFSYQWYYNLTNLLVGQNNANLGFESATDALVGAYHVVISNPVGVITSQVAMLTVINPPIITQQPTNVVTSPGATAIFSVTATGSVPLSYQWWFNTSRLTGATNTTLTITNVQSTNVGGYFVVVTNSEGAATSAVAQLSFQSLDTDGDGLPDAWELAYGLNPLNDNDANVDTDGDGLTNAQEYIAGTNPTNKLSTLKLETGAGGGGNQANFQFNAMSNKSYTIQYRNGLETNNNWQRFSDVVPAPTNRQIGITNTSTNSIRVYRIATPQDP
jgi:hypothetical protein